MKSYILHGENQPESRRKLLEIIGKLEADGWEIHKVDWHNTTREDLFNLCRAQSLLLNSGIALVVENFFTNNKKSSEIIKDLLKFKSEALLVFWEGKVVSQTARFDKDFIVQEFKIPVYIFKFLSSLVPGNASTAVKLLQEARKKDSADFLFIMMARHFGLLVWARLEPNSLKIPDWRREALIKQAGKFTVEQLTNLHEKLLWLDRLNKKSQLPENLSASLDLLTASI